MHLYFHRRHSLGRYARLAFTNLFVVIIFCECSVFPVSAYDTGHHTDLTRNALLAEGFNEQAIRVVILQNWLTDLYGAHPLPIPGSEIKVIKGDVEKLHFDNLFSTQEVRNYWIQLIANTQSAVTAAASREGDELRVLALIGISLHAVQDFYSHSNWIDIYQRPGDPFRPTTWIDIDNSGGIPLPSRIQTGWYGNDMFPVQPAQTQPHSDQLRSGQLINGLNKDSYRRFAWDQAYAFSYAATRQWINAIRTWVDLARLDGGEFWRTRVAKYSSCSLSDEGELKRDLESAYRLSEWAFDPFDGNFTDQDGHWKGPDSDNAPKLVAQFAAWSSRKSRFVELFKNKKIYQPLISGLYSRPTSDRPLPIAARPVNEHAIVVRTPRLMIQRPAGPQLPFGRKFISNMYARITLRWRVGADSFVQEVVESTQQNNFGSNPWFWYTIVFVPASVASVDVTYELLNEAALPTGDDASIDINSSTSKNILEFNFRLADQMCSGDINGVHNVVEAVSAGNGAETFNAEIGLIISRRPVVSQ